MSNSSPSEKLPTLEFDGDLMLEGGGTVPCAVQITFPAASYDPIAVSVSAPEFAGAMARPTRISTSPDHYRTGGADVVLERVWVRKWTASTYPQRRHLHPKIELGHVGRLLITRTDQHEEPPNRRDEEFFVKLSESDYLSPNSFAAVADSAGTLKFEQNHHLSATDTLLGLVTLERRHQFVAQGARDGHVSSELVARVERPVCRADGSIDAESTAASMEDLVLFASVASRHRIRIRGWRGQGGSHYEDAYLNPLEGSAGNPKLDRHDVLIPREKASQFLTHCAGVWDSFTEDERRKLRYACFALAPISERTVDTEFLALFSALEGIVSIFRARRGGDYVYGEKDTWRKLKKAIEQAIDTVHVEDSRYNPAAVKRNLAALRRVPLEESTKGVLLELGSWCDQLWPLFDQSGASLASIRNVLAHGEQLSREKLGALVLAKSHLHTILERTVCRALGWSLRDTAVSDSSMLGQERRFASEVIAGRAVLREHPLTAEMARVLPIDL